MCNNILKKSKYCCSGCGACAAICPQKAIKLKLNSKGFYTAVINDKKCIQCGMCINVCNRYADSIKGKDLRSTSLYALQSSEQLAVKQCSSGGVAYELAVQAIKEDKKVIGVVYNTETDRVEHIIAETKEQLSLLKGSKYLQSNPEHAFRKALNEAKKDKSAEYVVFGTPCQIAGLAKSCDLAGVREQFLFVEIFCHGVPTYKLWDEECRKIRKKLNIEKFNSVEFRYKREDWHSYCLRVKTDHKVFYGERERELFWQVYFENILLGDSCYQCYMRKEISVADIRLGDYWGRRFQQRKDGVSAVFACTERGEEALAEIINRGKVIQMEAGSPDEMLAAQNMEGYHQQILHDKAMNVLELEDSAMKAVKEYRKKLTGQQKAKRILLAVSSIIPRKIRIKLRKANSSRMLNKK